MTIHSAFSQYSYPLSLNSYSENEYSSMCCLLTLVFIPHQCCIRHGGSVNNRAHKQRRSGIPRAGGARVLTLKEGRGAYNASELDPFQNLARRLRSSVRR